MLLPLVGALQWALYQIGVRVNSRNDSAETILIWTALVGLVVTSLGVPFVWRTPDLTGALVLGGIVLAGSLGQIALIHAYRVSEASALQPFSYTLLVFAALLGFAVFGDVPGPFVFLGAAIIVASGLFAQFSSHARH
jgi:drug/metabolite transporter (DMT)-like permease